MLKRDASKESIHIVNYNSWGACQRYLPEGCENLGDDWAQAPGSHFPSDRYELESRVRVALANEVYGMAVLVVAYAWFPTAISPAYCTNKRGDFRTRDMDAPSLYTNPYHDVVMTLSARRTNLLLRLASLHVHDHQDEKCDFDLLSRPMFLLTNSLLMYSRISVQLTNATDIYPFPPACESIFVMAQGMTHKSRKMNARSRTIRTPGVHPTAQQLDRPHL
jgi:hypothetical protein